MCMPSAPKPPAPGAPPQAPKTPSLAAFMTRNQMRYGAKQQTMLTGPSGVQPGSMNLGSSTLLGS